MKKILFIGKSNEVITTSLFIIIIRHGKVFIYQHAIRKRREERERGREENLIHQDMHMNDKTLWIIFKQTEVYNVEKDGFLNYKFQCFSSVFVVIAYEVNVFFFLENTL